MFKCYPVRDKILVENGQYNNARMPLGMRTIKHAIAYLRHAIDGKIISFFYQNAIPNGIFFRVLCGKKNLLILNS